MKFKVASIILVIMGFAAIATLIYASFNKLHFTGPLGYAIIFIIVPAVASFGVWRKSKWGVLLALVFFLPQCINYISTTSSFSFMAPISLGIKLGTPNQGAAYIVNLFSIAMAIYMLILLKHILRHTLTTHSSGPADAGR